MGTSGEMAHHTAEAIRLAAEFGGQGLPGQRRGRRRAISQTPAGVWEDVENIRQPAIAKGFSAC
jgi:hypothetical protein